MKTLRLILLVACLFLQACSQSPSTPLASPSPENSVDLFKLVAVGDSLTEGLGVKKEESYPSQLQARLQANGLDWEVVNAGVSGETSSGALSRVDWILKTKPDAILLVTGANDSLRGIDPEITHQNLDTLLSKLAEQKVPVLVGGMLAPPNLGEDYGDKFAKIYPELTEKHKVPLIPFFLEGVARQPQWNQKDGKHPTAEGYGKVVDHIYPTVEAWLVGVAKP